MSEPFTISYPENGNCGLQRCAFRGVRVAVPGCMSVIDCTGRHYEVERFEREPGKIENGGAQSLVRGEAAQRLQQGSLLCQGDFQWFRQTSGMGEPIDGRRAGMTNVGQRPGGGPSHNRPFSVKCSRTSFLVILP